MQKMVRQMQLWGLVLMLGLLAACSPEYNWREISVSQDVGTALFPAKPRTQTRAIEFGEHELEFHLTTAKVGDTIFAVGHAAWPDALRNDKKLQRQLGESAITSLYRNLEQDPPAPLPALGELFEIHGTNAGLTALAYVWVSDIGIVQSVVMGPAHEFPQEAAKQFLDSLAQGR